jgi:hypothetical protein
MIGNSLLELLRLSKAMVDQRFRSWTLDLQTMLQAELYGNQRTRTGRDSSSGSHSWSFSTDDKLLAFLEAL